MRRASLYTAALLLVAAGMTASEAQAVVTLSLSSTANLDVPVPIGSTATINVNLSGLAPEELIALDVAVYFANLQASNFQWGGIVPADDRISSVGADEVSGSFWVADENISGEGVFFSFDASFSNPGPGDLRFSQYPTATQAGDPPLDLNAMYPDQITCNPAINAALSFTVTPEPSTWVLLGMAAVAAGSYLLKRRMSFTRF